MRPASLLRLGVLACIWGASFLLIKLALDGMAPVQLVLTRMGAGSAVLLGITLVRREALPRTPALLAHLTVLSLVANLIPFFLFAWGELRVSSGMAGVLNGSTPLFTMALAVLALPEERWSPARVTGLLLGFAGVVVVVGPWREQAGPSALTGQLACVAAAASYGVALVYARRYVTNRGWSPLSLSAVQLSIGTLLLVALAPVLAADPMTLTSSVVASALVLGAVGTGLAYLLFYRLIAEEGATSASTVTYLIPVVAVVLGVVALNEPLSWNLFVGAAVVIAGVALTEGRLRLPRASVDAPVVADREALQAEREPAGG